MTNSSLRAGAVLAAMTTTGCIGPIPTVERLATSDDAAFRGEEIGPHLIVRAHHAPHNAEKACRRAAALAAAKADEEGYRTVDLLDRWTTSHFERVRTGGYFTTIATKKGGTTQIYIPPSSHIHHYNVERHAYALGAAADAQDPNAASITQGDGSVAMADVPCDEPAAPRTTQRGVDALFKSADAPFFFPLSRLDQLIEQLKEGVKDQGHEDGAPEAEPPQASF